ncbi:13543_t:CDS:2, partial [Entrophospora sp. SA101]
HVKHIEQQLLKGCSIPTCDGTLEWKKCSAECKFISLDMPDENGYSYYLLHIGHHKHQHCIQNKPFNNEKEQLQKCVRSAPETLPRKLVVGQSLDASDELYSKNSKLSKKYN